MVWSTLKQFALSGGVTKMNMKGGKMVSMNSYSLTGAYLTGNYMALAGYTHIIPNPKYGVYGYNLGLVNLFIGSDYSMSSSAVVFWTKPYQKSKKITLSPQVFVMTPGASFNTSKGEVSYSTNVGFLLGTSVDYKITRKFGLSFNYKMNTSTAPGAPVLSNFLIGSRLML
jgi:hypothetical protein